MVSWKTAAGVALFLLAGAFSVDSAQADIQFVCTVEKTFDGVKYVPMERQLACPISVRLLSDNNGKEVTQASSCIIDQKSTVCRGTVKIAAGVKIKSVSTAPSLLRDDEITAGAVPASPELPLAQLSEDQVIATLKHGYFFPTPNNRFHNSTTPCDVDGDGRVSPLDLLVLNEFRRKNSWTVDLLKFDSRGEKVPFVDPTNNWVSDWRDEQAVLKCLNSR